MSPFLFVLLAMLSPPILVTPSYSALLVAAASATVKRYGGPLCSPLLLPACAYKPACWPSLEALVGHMRRASLAQTPSPPILLPHLPSAPLPSSTLGHAPYFMLIVAFTCWGPSWLRAPGTSISMPPPLMDGQIEYPDGTPATVSQVRIVFHVFSPFGGFRVQTGKT